MARQTSKSASVETAQISPTVRGSASVSTIARSSRAEADGRDRLLEVRRALVAGVFAPDGAVDTAPGVDAADAFDDQVGRAQVELDGLGRRRPLLDAVVALRPEEEAVDDLARLVDHAGHQVLGGERSLLHQDGAQPLARSHRVRTVYELLQADASAAQELLAQPVVGARRRGKDHLAVLHGDGLAHAGARERDLAAPALLVERQHQGRKVALRQAAFALHATGLLGLVLCIGAHHLTDSASIMRAHPPPGGPHDDEHVDPDASWDSDWASRPE